MYIQARKQDFFHLFSLNKLEELRGWVKEFKEVQVGVLPPLTPSLRYCVYDKFRMIFDSAVFFNNHIFQVLAWMDSYV